MARSEELVIEARNVYKYYRRKIQALNDISLTIKKVSTSSLLDLMVVENQH